MSKKADDLREQRIREVTDIYMLWATVDVKFLLRRLDEERMTHKLCDDAYAALHMITKHNSVCDQRDASEVWKVGRDIRPARGGWAFGDYLNRCLTCNCMFQGDKRAFACADCAYAEKETQG